MLSRCKATNAAGEPCSAGPVRADGYCYWHSPALEAERQANRRKGGAGRSNANRARKALPAAGTLTIDELRAVLESTIAKTLHGSIEPGVANAVASLARAYGSLSEAAKLEELTDRLDHLEATARRGGVA
jgi:hypothetical protein